MAWRTVWTLGLKALVFAEMWAPFGGLTSETQSKVFVRLSDGHLRQF